MLYIVYVCVCVDIYVVLIYIYIYGFIYKYMDIYGYISYIYMEQYIIVYKVPVLMFPQFLLLISHITIINMTKYAILMVSLFDNPFIFSLIIIKNYLPLFIAFPTPLTVCHDLA